MLHWTIYISFIAAALLFLFPVRLARWVALIGMLASWGLGISAFIKSDGSMQSLTQQPWIPSLGIEYFLGADGISLLLVVLTGLAGTAGVLFSWNIANREKEFFALYLTLIGGVYGVFLSFDLFLLFVFYELAIIPKYFLIAIWGSTNREYGAMKLALYSFIGSAMVLIGILAAYVMAGSTTTNLIKLAEFPFPETLQHWAFPLTFIGFGVLAGLWPFHSWAPTGHVAAPTGASMLLAGVVMKLGAYGALRVAMTLFPAGMRYWHDEIAWLAVIGIIYGALIALVQTDLKFVIGYSSVSHMGFVLLGLVTLNTIGISGAVLQMVSHGIIASLLFGVVGRMIYDRTHTRDLNRLGQLDLRKVMPFAAGIFLVACLASMGLPGFSGFVAELQVLIGAWQTFPSLAVLAGLGILVGMAYTLRVLQKSFFSDATADRQEHTAFEPITLPERLGALVLVAATIAIGLFPNFLLKLIQASFDSPLFDGLKKGGPL